MPLPPPLPLRRPSTAAGRPNRLPPPSARAQGELAVHVELQFPASLTPAQKALIRAALLLPAKLSEPQTHAVHAFEAAFSDKQHGWSTGFTKRS